LLPYALSFRSAAMPWGAGTATLDITPSEPAWQSGYAHRSAKSTGVLQPLRAKALAIRSAGGALAVLVTLDLVGVSREMSAEVSRRLGAFAGVEPDAVRVVASHTHSGPSLASELRKPQVLNDLRTSEAEAAAVRAYTAFVVDQAHDAAVAAVGQIAEASLAVGVTEVGFATNRRRNTEERLSPETMRGMWAQCQCCVAPALPDGRKGPADHTVDVLRFLAADDGRALAVVYGYACHNTVLDGSLISGDWSGFASEAVEAALPSCTAFFVPGCGGDQNPVYRRSEDLARTWGGVMASAVVELVRGAAMDDVAPTAELAVARSQLELPLERLPSGAEIGAMRDTARAAEDLCPTLVPENYDAVAAAKLNANTGADLVPLIKEAKRQWADLMEAGDMAASVPFYISTWAFGLSFLWVALSDEPVVAYAERIRQLAPAAHVMATGYSDSVSIYIPSETVLLEGGYEGGENAMWYGKAGKFQAGVEGAIVGECAKQIAEVGRARETDH